MKFHQPFILFLMMSFPAFSAVGTLSLTVKVDHFGWRPGDRKIAVFTQNPGSPVEIRNALSDSVAWTVNTITYAGQDEDSGDTCWLADFSGLTEEGSYYAYSPALGIRSYQFDINPWVYNRPAEAVVRSYYYQRCNHAKEEPYSGPWQDGVCHTADFAMTRWTGGDLAGHGYIGPQPDYGTLDLHGGWHDAGDYQKTPHWDRGVLQMLWAYEINPSVWKDGHLNIPESGNGIPDLLDEISWELDFYVRCQRPGGHFLSSASGRGGNTPSPPSANNETRQYIDAWRAEATARSVSKLAHASTLYRSLGSIGTAKADLYETAAMNGWNWLTATNLSGNNNKLKCVAASAVWRMNPAVVSAKNFVESWSGGWDVPSNDTDFIFAHWNYLASSGTAPGVVSAMRSAILGGNWNGVVNQIFFNQGVYGGLRGHKDNVWDWHWGSNKNQASFGFNLLMALRYDITGTYSSNQIREQAQKYLHFLFGRNTLSMLYLTSMHDYGGEHSSYQLFHSWFGFPPNWPGHDGGYNPSFNGKPVSVDEPFYPYYPDDNQTSLYGPAPGLLVGGPNLGYGGTWSPPKGIIYPAKAYRDFSAGCVWDGSKCTASSWEITENSLGYSGPLVGLLAFFMGENNPYATENIRAVFATNDSRLDLFWKPYGGGGIDYKVTRHAADRPSVTNDAGTATNWSDTAVDRGRTYRYDIQIWSNGSYLLRAYALTVFIPRYRLTGFTAVVLPADIAVSLNWNAFPAVGAVYEIIRTLADGSRATNISAGAAPGLKDTAIRAGMEYKYKVLAFTNGLAVAESVEIPITIPALEAGLQVRRNFIRPADGDDAAEIRVIVPSSGMTLAVDIFDAGGRKVRSWSASGPEPGIWTALWPAEDQNGKPVPSGVYIVSVRLDGRRLDRSRIMVVR